MPFEKKNELGNRTNFVDIWEKRKYNGSRQVCLEHNKRASVLRAE
jgi:hypothetical protein